MARWSRQGGLIRIILNLARDPQHSTLPPVWQQEAVPSVGELIPGHPLSVGEKAREGGVFRARERDGETEGGRKKKKANEIEREYIYNSVNASFHTVLLQIESPEYIFYFVAIYWRSDSFPESI